MLEMDMEDNDARTESASTVIETKGEREGEFVGL